MFLGNNNNIANDTSQRLIQLKNDLEQLDTNNFTPYNQKTIEIKNAIVPNCNAGCLIDYSYDELLNATTELKQFFANNSQPIGDLINRLTRIEPKVQFNDDDPFI